MSSNLTDLTEATTFATTDLFYTVVSGNSRKATWATLAKLFATGTIPFAAGTITTSQPLTVTQTWNAAGVTFVGISLAVTNTASNVASKLMSLTAGASAFNVVYNGNDVYAIIPDVNGAESYRLASSRGLYVADGSGGVSLRTESGLKLNITDAGATIASNMTFGFGATTAADNAPDTMLTRGGAAATLQIGAANVDLSANVVAQTLRTQGPLAGGTSNQAGKDFTLLASPGKGTGAGGQLILQTTPAGASGTSINAAATGLTITAPVVNMQPSVVVGNQALATTATDGFLYIPTCDGTPTGTPTTFTGRVAMIFDTTNNKFYIYDGSWLGGTVPGAFV